VASSLIAALLVRGFHLPGSANGLPGLWSEAILALDYIVGLMLTAQTLGMRLLGLRVARVDVPARRLDIGRVVIRTILLLLLVPAVIMDRHQRGLHDRVTDVAVVNG
jgi:uncharacterized RDD family membrane protein YckC